MELEQIYFISEIVAAAAVIASLVYVGVQLRQNTQTNRTAAGQVHVDAYAELIRQLTESPSVMDAWVKSAQGLDHLTPQEQTYVFAFVGVAFRNFEGAWIQHEDGVLEERFWTGMFRTMSDQYLHPAFRAFWAERRHWYSDEFASWFDREIAGPVSQSSGAQASGSQA